MEPLKNGCDFFLHLEKHAASAFVFPSRGRTIQFVEFLLWSIRLSSRCVAMLTPVNRAHCHLSGSSGSMERESLWGNILQSKHVYPVQHSHFIVKSKYSTPGVCKLYQNSWIKLLAYQPFKPMNVHLFKMFSSPKLWTSAKQVHAFHASFVNKTAALHWVVNALQMESEKTETQHVTTSRDPSQRWNRCRIKKASLTGCSQKIAMWATQGHKPTIWLGIVYDLSNP